PEQGLAARAHVMGVALLDSRQGHPALTIADTTFQRFPYFHTTSESQEMLDYAGMARVIEGLARTIDALAGAART
ncbi:MAG: hypothetical protein ACREWI_18215, partial [Telluria sp.]